MKTQYIDRFELVRRIGTGSQAIVYLARDNEIDREVAIKLLKPNELGLGQVKDNIFQEARAVGRLSHPNIVPIYEVGAFYDYPYFVFEYVDGMTLHEFLDTQPMLTIPEALAILKPVIDAMAYAHSQGVLHLDLTPKNILFNGNDAPRIMDFGLAQLSGTHTESRDWIAGTPTYMSPEHFTDTPLGPYTDVYALSLILYEMLVGKPAITGETLAEAMWQILEEPVDLSLIPEGRDKEKITYILQRGLMRDTQSRYDDVTIMKHALGISLDEAISKTRARNQNIPLHGTIDFLLRRMQRRGDFPALSRSLTEINSMAADDSTASANQLATAVLKDYALTNKLLKIANSAFYASFASKVSNVSHAIRILGFNQVRFAANSLAYFSHLKDMANKSGLQDTMIKSFMSGLIARHLAKSLKMTNAEEAFICGMFQNVGETLTAYYLPEEYEEITNLLNGGTMNMHSAAYSILGVSFTDIGSAVANHWNFPDIIVDAISGAPSGSDIPDNQLGRLALFANEICHIAGATSRSGSLDALEQLLEQYRQHIPVEMERIPAILEAALKMLHQYADILGMNVEESSYCANIEAWITDEESTNHAAVNTDTEIPTTAPSDDACQDENTLQAKKLSWLEKIFARPLAFFN